MEQATTWQKLKNGDYPIITLEWRKLKRGKGRVAWLVLLAAGVAAASFLVLVSVILKRMEPGRSGVGLLGLPPLAIVGLVVLSLLKWVVALLIVPIYCARTIAGEKEAGSLQMLAITPMSSPSIIGQKMSIGLGYALATVLISLPALVAACLVQPETVPGIGSFSFPGMDVMSNLTYPITAALYAATGVWCSCSCANTRTATMLTFVLILFVLPTLMSLPMIPMFFLGFENTVRSGRFETQMYAVMVLHTLLSVGFAVLFTWLAIRKFDWMRRWIGGGA